MTTFKAVIIRRRPCGTTGDMPVKFLSVEITILIYYVRRQVNVVFDPGLMFGWTSNLDNFSAGRAFEYAMADLGRLKDAISGLEPKRFALVLVNDLYPAPFAIDHLKIDLVIMHVIGNFAVERKAYVRNDNARFEAVRSEIAIKHSDATRDPFGEIW